MDEKIKNRILDFQKSEITEHFIYKELAERIKDLQNQEVLRRISADECRHYGFWKKYTEQEVKPDRFKIWKYVLISRIFGLTFGLKLMENGEGKAQESYHEIAAVIPKAKEVIDEEEEHERQVLNMIGEEKLEYVGSAVLGLNDALVELTGAMAGFTLALQNARLVATAGLITGLAASFSMAASEYLSTKSEAGGKNPVKASFYTGCAYVATVMLLIAPFLILNRIFVSLGISILIAILIILAFTFYTSVAKDLPFKKRFLEMSAISLGVAALTFGIVFLVRMFFGIDV